MNKKLKVISIFFISILVILIILFIYNKNNSNNDFLKESDIKVEFIKPDSFEDTYMLNIDEDKNDYLRNNIVEAADVIPISNRLIKTNNRVLMALKEMYDNNDYSDLIVRRGYLTNSESTYQGVSDHKSGYDVDFFIEGKEWTDFEGYESADDLIKNSYKYGFVLRYPDYPNYQPYHYRYVGIPSAKIIHDKDLTLSDYISNLDKLELNQIYNVDGSSYKLYVVKKDDVTVPKYYNYEISSFNSKKYVIFFDTEKDIKIKKSSNNKNVVENEIKDMKILYDLTLLNSEYEIPKEMLNNVKLVSVTKYLSSDNDSSLLLDETVLKQLKPLMEKTNELDRHTTYLTSAYRSYETQKNLYEHGDKNVVQVPNHSEHQTGLSFDISNSYKSNDGFTETYQGMWFDNHAKDYGFIRRYPADKTSITGISEEQWHYRYVGELSANIIQENNLTLEEYVDFFEKDVIYNVSWNDKKYVFYKSNLKDGKIKTLENLKEIYYLKDNCYLSILEV